jgi:hypothetical protein
MQNLKKAKLKMNIIQKYIKVLFHQFSIIIHIFENNSYLYL